MPEEIKAYKTDDGSVFEELEKAEEHQQYLDFHQELNILIEEAHIPYYDNKQMVYDFVVDNYDKLKKLIEKYPKFKAKEDDYP